MFKFSIWLLSSLFSTLSISYLFLKLTNTKPKLNLKLFFIYLITILTVTTIEYFHYYILNPLSYFLFIPIIFTNLKKMAIKKTLYYVISIWFCGISLDLISLLLASLLYKLFHSNIDSLKIIFSFLVFSCFIIIGNIKIFLKFINNSIENFLKIKYLDFIIILFTIFILSIGIIMLINFQNLNINLFLSLIIILITITFTTLIYHKLNSLEITKYLTKLKHNNDFYIERENEHRIFKHNLIAKLSSIKSVSNQKTKTLINDIIKEFNKSLKLSTKITEIPYGLNGLIYEQLNSYIDELNISITNSINYDILDYLKPRRYNVFIEKLIISLDNAIEASLKSHNKLLIINIYEEENLIIIEIKNSFSDTIHIDTIGNNGYSTKNKKRGLGLFSSLRNNEAKTEIKIINNFFICKITAKKSIN